MADHIKIPVLFKTEDAIIAQKKKYKRWEISDPSPQEQRDDDLWYTFDDQIEQSTVCWPEDVIGHYHPAEGNNTRLYHRHYDVSYIVPLTVEEFEDLILIETD